MTKRRRLAVNLIWYLLSIGMGCSSKEPPPSDENNVPSSTVASTTAQTIPPEGSEDVNGLKVTVSKDGHIKVEGTDIFHGKLDVIYESADYLLSAVPVLKRSLTPEQTEGLSKVAARLGGKVITPEQDSAQRR